ncbi:MAG: ATP-dependent RecD-like DNA helicase, partial [Clostridiales bacterium]|nr:ATP-dependent RecD-like DNA helicase [Clostridiales bacterium]
MEKIEGTIEEIIFQNEENGYKICLLCCNGNTQAAGGAYNQEFITVRGLLPFTNAGEKIVVSGKWDNHPEYGEQFTVSSYEKVNPANEEEIEAYLNSGLIEGVGKVTASLMVSAFGKNALAIIAETPEKLEIVKGISHSKAMKIHSSYIEQKNVSDIVMFLHKYGIGAGLALKVYKKYGGNAIPVIESNPYKIIDDIPGVGFKTADQLAQSLGIAQYSDERVKAGLIYLLQQGVQNGHCYLPFDILLENSSILEVDRDKVVDNIQNLAIDGRINIVNAEGCKNVYLNYMNACETRVAQVINEICENRYDQDEKNIENMCREFELLNKITLAGKQKEAVKAAMMNGVLIITGGPGTGKTTIIKCILYLMDKLGIKALLAAPTGRAAKRMSESCGVEAKTIHRLLEINFMGGEEEEPLFNRNESNPLDADAIILDEVSMLDILLMNSFMKAVKAGTRLIFVGDRDQLPSVGPGKVLRDLISSKKIPTVVLDEIFRQSDKSLIAFNAKYVNNGMMPDLNSKDKDFFMIRRESPRDIVATIIDLCIRRLPEAYSIDPFTSIQVIAPSKKGMAGVINLNTMLQAAMNPKAGTTEREFHGVLYREGDKVMQIKNNYEIKWKRLGKEILEGQGIFNGEMGILAKIDVTSRELTVIFDDDRVAIYEFSNADQLEHAFAITVHKSQG